MESNMKVIIEGLFAGKVKPFGPLQTSSATVSRSADPDHNSAIIKSPLQGKAELTLEGLTEDQQADRRFHGGEDKALHHFARENYPILAEHYPQLCQKFVSGSIGENISTEGLNEHNACIGDVFNCGTAIIQISQPRRPCWKIDHRYGAKKAALFIQQQGITGWYYRVLQPGQICAGDTLMRVGQEPNPISIQRIWQEHHNKTPDLELLEKLTILDALNKDWRLSFQKRLNHFSR